MRHLLLATVLLAGCTPIQPPQRHSFDPTHHISASEDVTWDAVIAVFGERTWPISTLERVSGFIATDWLSVSERTDVLDCGGNRYAQNRGQVRFNVVVKADSDAVTALTVNAAMRGPQPVVLGSGGGVLTCFSTGVLEAEIAEAVTRVVGT